jgi:MFS family permease
MVKSKLKEDLLKKKSRRECITEGIFATAKTSVGEYFVTPFAIAINSSNSLTALLSSLSGLLGPFSQIFSSRLIGKYSRKKIILKTVFAEAIMWLPFILIAVLFYKGILVNVLPFLLLLTFTIYTIILNLSSPIWFSWVGDIVGEKNRGRWFSKRNLIIGFVSAVLTISASFFLDNFTKKGLMMFGFIILFSLASIFRLISWRIFRKQYEPKIKVKKADYFSFWDFLKEAPKTNFGKFAIFRATLFFASYITASLVAVYLLRILGFNYKTYMIILFSGTIFSLVVLEIWGKFADKYGNYRVLLITSFFIPFIPILWILSPNPFYLMFVPSLIGGIYSAGFNLSVGNFIYDNVSSKKRGFAVSYSNMLNGVGIFFGAGLGAILIKFITTTSIEPIKIIFIIGAVLRVIPIVIFLPRLKEVRKTKKFKGPKAFNEIIFKEAKPILIEEAHEIISIPKYIHLK